MTSFADFPPLNQPEHRLGILAMLPEKAILALVHVAVRDQDMGWLEPMARGGILDPDDLRKASGTEAVVQGKIWQARAEAFIGFVKNIGFDALHHDAVIGQLDPPLAVLSHRPTEETRTLFAYAVGRTVPVLKHMETSHAEWSAIVDPVDHGVAALLMGAIAMDLPDVVRNIVHAFPDVAAMEFSMAFFGTPFAMGTDNTGKPAPLKRQALAMLNAAGVAMRLSRTECLDALIEANPKAMESLGQVNGTDGGARNLGLSSLHHFMEPGYTPAMWAKVMAIEANQRPWQTKEPEEDDQAPPTDTGDRYELLELLRGPQNKAFAPYLKATIAAGVFDAHPEISLPMAMANGHTDLVVRMLDLITDWNALEVNPAMPGTPILAAAEMAIDENNPEKKAAIHASILAFLKGTLERGSTIALGQSSAWQDDNQPNQMEPFTSVAKAGFHDVLVLFVEHGFDVHQRCPPDEFHPEPKTVLDFLETAAPEAAAVVKSCLARRKAFHLIDEMDESPTAVSKP